jgi:hypothetical protein
MGMGPVAGPSVRPKGVKRHDNSLHKRRLHPESYQLCCFADSAEGAAMKMIKGKPTCLDCGQLYTSKVINGSLYVAHLCQKVAA